MQNPLNKEYQPRVPTIFRLLSGKWKLLILWYLSRGGMKFSDLKVEIGVISSSVLTAQLKELQEDALIEKMHAFHRRLSYYSLTPLGKTLTPLFQAINNWEKSSALIPPDKVVKSKKQVSASRS